MKSFDEYLKETKEIGYIDSLFDYIAFVTGLPGAKLGEMVITKDGQIGFVEGLKENQVEILMLETKRLKVGQEVVRTKKEFEVEVGPGLLGRIVDPLCHPRDDLGPIIGPKIPQKIKKKPQPFIKRARIKKPLETGVLIVDFLVPIGYGQRELIIGDAKTGKTTFLLQVILSQVKKGIVPIYVAIGKKDIAIKWVEDYFKKAGILSKIIILHTTPDDSPVLNYLAPFTGMAIAEYFRDQGKDVLIIFDDLTFHAKIYREISLLLKRNPGRDAYPGDIFHLHAELLERAGNIKLEKGEVSITALPVAETIENDLTGYIQTNLMAMTDGHIFFDLNEFRAGKRPAINTFLSVSRLGNQTRAEIEKQIANWLRKTLSEYRMALEISQFGAELPLETKRTIEIGKKLELLFQQESQTIFCRELQLILMGLLIFGFWEKKSIFEMEKDIDRIVKGFEKNLIPSFPVEIEKIKDLDHLRFLILEILPEIEKIISYAKFD